MATYPTGEDLFIKTRKPYTITKQRERWTEDEHNRFLDALKLYGRAWQRIEEHIGTKTAVQIRSHAQKFFSKLEKEAHARGVPLGQTLNIEIPPPRPKRKPSNPYPRKSSTNAPTTSSIVSEDGKPLTSASSLHHGEQILHFKNGLHPEKHAGNEKSARADEPPEDENCSEVITFFKEPPCTSMSSANQSSIPESVVLENSCPVRESMPLLENISNQGTKDESDLSMESKENQKSDGTEAHYADLDLGTSKTPDLENCFCKSHERSLHGEISDELKQPERFCPLPIDELQSNRYHPKHVPVIGGNTETCIPNQSPNKYPSSIFYQVGGSRGNPNFFTNQITEQKSNSSMSFGHQSSPNLAPPFAPYLDNQDTYSSLLNISSTFPNLIISALLQNPTAHMAASLAASFWPCTNVESVESPAGALGGFPFRQMSPSPNLAAIAAATVAAASAWWTTHGVLPFCPPLHTGFTCPAASIAVASVETGQFPVVNRGKDCRPLDPPWEGQQLDPEFAKSLKLQNSASKLSTSPSSDSEESGVRRSNSNELSAAVQEEEPAPIDGQGDSNKVKTRKKAGRSSCGSNTPSSSEVEINALENTESKEPDVIHPSSEPNNRRNRTPANSNDQSWKEVSEEGRLAFQALFSREVLPQSFSPPHDLRDKDQHKNSVEGKQKSNKIDDENVLQLDLNGKTWDVSPDHPCSDKSDLSSSKSSEIGLLSIGLGQGKLRNRRTGFKPYKRCSMEVKESRIANGSSQVEENDPKRIRLEAGALR